MYTLLEDKKQAEFFKMYMTAHPDCIKKNIIKDCYTNYHRLKYLEQQGLIKLPDPMPRGLRNGLKFRKQNEKQTQT
jgi:hypothetical protein